MCRNTRSELGPEPPTPPLHSTTGQETGSNERENERETAAPPFLLNVPRSQPHGPGHACITLDLPMGGHASYNSPVPTTQLSKSMILGTLARGARRFSQALRLSSLSFKEIDEGRWGLGPCSETGNRVLPPPSSVPSLPRTRAACRFAKARGLLGTLCVASPLPVCTEKATGRSHCRAEGLLKSPRPNHVWYLQP